MPHDTHITLGLILTAALLDGAAHPELAHACSGPCSRLSVVPFEANVVAAGGATLLACNSCSEAPPALEAVDGSGAAYAGQLTELAREEPWWPFSSRTYFVWRPAQPLPSGDYALRAVDGLDGEIGCSLRAFEEDIHVPDASAAAEPLPEVVLQLGTTSRAGGTVFECTDTCEVPGRPTRSQHMPYLEHRIPVGPDHPARASLLVRLIGRTEEGTIKGEWWPLDAVDDPTYTEDGVEVAYDMQHGGVTFPAVQDEYCAEVELFDVVNDMHTMVDAGCVQHDLEADRVWDRPGFYSPCKRLVDATQEEYLEAFCKDNEAECDGSSEAYCESWRKHCTAAVPNAKPDDAGIAADAGQPERDSSAQDQSVDQVPRDASARTSDTDGRKPRSASAGGCRVGGAMEPSALAWSMLLAAWFRRRRRPRPNGVR